MHIDQDTLILILGGVAIFLLGWLISKVFCMRQISDMRNQNTELQTTLEMERRIAIEHLTASERARIEMANTFSALSSEALKNNNESFLRLAQEKLRQFHIRAEDDLKAREKSVEGLVKPIQDALVKTEQQIRRMEHERKEAYGSLTRYLETMTQTQQMLQSETRNLVSALRRPEVRGQWGELTLKRLVEIAGMVEHCDFYEQENVSTESGNLRPDMIIRMPAGREIVVDVKTPLDAYLNAIEAKDDQERDRELDRHLRNLRQRIKELATKAYWNQFKKAPDFVVLFIPGDQFLSAALERDYNLLEEALVKKVILATPTSLVALLRAIAYGWRQETLAENADRIRQLGEELYQRLSTFGEHLNKLGKNLGGSVDAYNRAVGSLERQVLTGARKLNELGIESQKTLDTLEPIDKTIRSVQKDDLDQDE